MSMGHDIIPSGHVTREQADSLYEVAVGKRMPGRPHRGILACLRELWRSVWSPRESAIRASATEIDRVYLSASYTRKREVAAAAAEMRLLGCSIASTWHDELDDSDDVGAENAGQLALQDLEEIRDSNVLVAFTDDHPTRAGHHTEFGGAAILGLRLVVVGPVEHHFHRLSWVERVDDVVGLLGLFRGVG
jgi:hypothetical protein